MKLDLKKKEARDLIDVEMTASYILKVQKENGEIPWSEGGKTDPWDHVESTMGLDAAGYLREAENAFQWLARTQLEDGSWWAYYRDGKPEIKRKDANMSSYISVGLLHHYLITEDRNFLQEMWPSLYSAIEHMVSLQAPTGEIYWSKNENGVIERRALLTGSCSMYMSIKCALAIASILGKTELQWKLAQKKLYEAIKNRPHLFDQTKARYSMDWYYPVLCGIFKDSEGKKRIQDSWDKFVVDHWGVRCVSDQPWVTMAETCELVLSLTAVGDFEKASTLFDLIKDRRDDDGAYWTGVTFPDEVIWPEERTTWTAAAMLLANDALCDLTPGAQIFNHNFWESNPFYKR